MFDVSAIDTMRPGPALAAALAAVDPVDLDRAQTLCWLRAWERQSGHDESRRYDVLAHWADLHPALDDETPASAGTKSLSRPDDERAMRPGGVGTPEVAEFAVTDLAVAISCTTGRAEGLLGDALSLWHRMPRLGERLAEGAVSPFKARMVVRAARGLSELAARRLDQRVSTMADKVGPRRLEREVARVLHEVDPMEAERRAAAAREARRVDVTTEPDGDKSIHAHVDAFDGAAFDAAVDLVADILGDLGDEQVKDVRRAAAVGWLANPVAVLALVQRHRALLDGSQPLPWPTSSIPTVTDEDGHTHLKPGLWPMDVPTPHDLIDPSLWPTTTLVIHIDHDTWRQPDGVHPAAGTADLTGQGPITADQVFARLRHSQVVIKPVVDLADEVTWVSDGAAFTGALREAVQLAHPWNPFPYADAETSHRDDIDHTLPHRLGGPTRLGNGAPLRRRLHRHKTFAKGWRVRQPFTGIYLWSSPEGRIYLVDRRGHTHDLGHRDSGRRDGGGRGAAGELTATPA